MFDPTPVRCRWGAGMGYRTVVRIALLIFIDMP